MHPEDRPWQRQRPGGRSHGGRLVIRFVHGSTSTFLVAQSLRHSMYALGSVYWAIAYASNIPDCIYIYTAYLYNSDIQNPQFP